MSRSATHAARGSHSIRKHSASLGDDWRTGAPRPRAPFAPYATAVVDFTCCLPPSGGDSLPGRLAQSARAPALHAGCRVFESRTAHHFTFTRNSLSAKPYRCAGPSQGIAYRPSGAGFHDVPSLTPRLSQRAPDHTSFPSLTPIRLSSPAFSLFQRVHPLRRPVVAIQRLTNTVFVFRVDFASSRVFMWKIHRPRVSPRYSEWRKPRIRLKNVSGVTLEAD